MKTELAPLNVAGTSCQNERLSTAAINAAIEYLENPFLSPNSFPSAFSAKEAVVENNNKDIDLQTREAKSSDNQFSAYFSDLATAPAVNNIWADIVPVDGSLDRSYELMDEAPVVPENRLPCSKKPASKAHSTASLFSDTNSFISDACSIVSPKQSEVKSRLKARRPSYGSLSPEEKIERRRAQNRAAASKCRIKKQEKYRELMTATEDLEYQNKRLYDEVGELRSLLSSLKAEVMAHKNCKFGGFGNSDNDSLFNMSNNLVSAAQ